MSELGVLDALPDGVVVADGSGTVVELNRTARSMLGGGDLGAPLEEVLLLQDQDGNTWAAHNTPYRGLSTRTGVPEQAWTLPSGSAVPARSPSHRSAVSGSRGPRWRPGRSAPGPGGHGRARSGC